MPKDKTITTPAMMTTIPEMIKIEGGSFNMGSNASEKEQPIHEVTLPDFFIAKYTVTNDQFAVFLNAYKSEEILEGANKRHRIIHIKQI